MNPQNHLARFMPPGFRAAIFFARFIYGDSRRTKQKRDYRLSMLRSELLQIWQACRAKSRTGQMNKHFLDVGLHHVGDANIFVVFRTLVTMGISSLSFYLARWKFPHSHVSSFVTHMTFLSQPFSGRVSHMNLVNGLAHQKYSADQRL